MPGAIRECEGPQCGVWVFQGNKGQAMWQGGAIADLTVEKFDGRAFLISRADPVGSVSSPYGINGHFTARYVGTINGDHIDGTVTFNGNERDVRPWSATIPTNLCNPMQNCPLNISQLEQLGDNSFGHDLYSAAISVLTVTAQQGDAEGQAMLAFVLYEDQKPHARNSEAFVWSKKSALGNNSDGQIMLGKFYREGFGTPANQEFADYWMAKGHAQRKLDEQALAQNQQARANAQAAFMMALITSFMGSGDGSSSHSKPGVYGYSGEGPVEKQQNQEDWHDRGGNGSAPDGWHQGGDIPGKEN
jgi:hypothetical protein